MAIFIEKVAQNSLLKFWDFLVGHTLQKKKIRNRKFFDLSKAALTLQICDWESKFFSFFGFIFFWKFRQFLILLTKRPKKPLYHEIPVFEWNKKLSRNLLRLIA